MMNEIKKKEAGHAFADRPKSRRETDEERQAKRLELIRLFNEWTPPSVQTPALPCQDVPGTREGKRAESVHKEKP
jgi:hypothetical protein